MSLLTLKVNKIIYTVRSKYLKLSNFLYTIAIDTPYCNENIVINDKNNHISTIFRLINMQKGQQMCFDENPLFYEGNVIDNDLENCFQGAAYNLKKTFKNNQQVIRFVDFIMQYVCCYDFERNVINFHNFLYICNYIGLHREVLLLCLFAGQCIKNLRDVDRGKFLIF